MACVEMLGASPAPLRDKVVLHAVDDGVVLGGSPMPEPVLSAGSLCPLQGSGSLCPIDGYVGVVLGVSPMPSQCALARVPGVSLGICVGRGPWRQGSLCPIDALRLGVSPMPEPRSSLHLGPYWASRSLLVRKVQVMLLVGDGVVQSRSHDVVQGLVVTEVLFGLGLELEQ